MAQLGQTIQQQRTEIAQAQQQASQMAQQRQEFTQRQLLSSQGGLASRAQRQAQAQLRKRQAQQQLASLKVQQKQFETQVAKSAPQYAQPEYLEASYVQAKKAIEGRVSQLSSKLASQQQKRASAMERGDASAIRSSESAIEELQAELGSYQSSLRGPKEKVVQDYYSGRTEALASYQRSREEALNIQSEQKRAFAQSQGFKNYAELQKAVQAQKLGPVTSEVKVMVQQKPVTQETYVVTPPGYWDEQILETYSAYEKQIPESERRKMTQYEISSMVTSDPSYQRELQKIQEQKETQERMKKFAEARKYPTPEKYGEVRIAPATTQIKTKEFISETDPFRFEGEVYNPRTGTFQAPVYEMGAGGTAYERTPSMQEQRQIQAAIEREKEIYQRGVGAVQRGVERLGPVLDSPIKSFVEGPVPSFSVARKIVPPPKLTVGESLAMPAKGIGFIAETAAEGWEDIYGTAIRKIPKKNWPGKWVGGEFEERPRKGTQAWADAIDAGKVIPVSPEQVGKGVETTLKVGTYAVPYVGAAYMGSQFFEGAEIVRKPEKQAEEIFQEQIVKPYEESYALAEKGLKEGEVLEQRMTTEELRKEYMPGIVEQVKFGGAVEAGTSLFFLGAAGSAKALQYGKRMVTPVKTKTRGEAVFDPEFRYKVGVTPEGGGKLLEMEGTQWIIQREITTAQSPFQKIFTKKPPKVVEDVTKIRTRSFEPIATESIGGLPIFKVKDPMTLVVKKAGKTTSGAPDMFRIRTKGRQTTFEEVLPQKQYKDLLEETYKRAGQRAAREDVLAVQRSNVFRLKTDKRIKYRDDVYGSMSFFKKTVGEEGKLIFEGEAGTVLLKSARPRAKVGDVSFAKLKVETVPFVEAGKGVEFVQPAKIIKTPFDDTFQIQAKKAVQKVIKDVPPMVPKYKPSPVAKQVSKPQPSYLGGVKYETPSAYAGTGLYEKTDVSVQMVPARVQQPVISDVRVDVGTIPTVDTKFFTVVQDKSISRTKVKPSQVLITRPTLLEEQLPVQIPVVKVSPFQFTEFKQKVAPSEVQVPRTILRQVYEQPQIPVRRVFQPQAPRVPKLGPPRVKPPVLIPRLKPVKVRTMLKAPPKEKLPEKGYSFKVRRKGKWERANLPFAFATKEGAEAAAQRKVLSEAAVSYEVVPARKGKKVVKTNLKKSPYQDILFRKGKEPGVMVQKKLLRILTSGEKKEISYAGALAKMKKSEVSFFKDSTKKKAKKKTSKKGKGGKKKK